MYIFGRFGKDNETARRSDCDRLLEGTLAPALQCFSHEVLRYIRLICFIHLFACALCLMAGSFIKFIENPLNFLFYGGAQGVQSLGILEGLEKSEGFKDDMK